MSDELGKLRLCFQEEREARLAKLRSEERRFEEDLKAGKVTQKELAEGKAAQSECTLQMRQ